MKAKDIQAVGLPGLFLVEYANGVGKCTVLEAPIVRMREEWSSTERRYALTSRPERRDGRADGALVRVEEADGASYRPAGSIVHVSLAKVRRPWTAADDAARAEFESEQKITGELLAIANGFGLKAHATRGGEIAVDRDALRRVLDVFGATRVGAHMKIALAYSKGVEEAAAVVGGMDAIERTRFLDVLKAMTA